MAQQITGGYGVPDPAGLPPKFALLGELPISPKRYTLSIIGVIFGKSLILLPSNSDLTIAIALRRLLTA